MCFETEWEIPVQVHPRSLILLPIKSAYAPIVTLVLFCPVSEIFADFLLRRSRDPTHIPPELWWYAQKFGGIWVGSLYSEENLYFPLTLNAWPRMTLNSHFTLNFHYYEIYEHRFILHTYRRAYLYNFCCITWSAEMYGSGSWSSEYWESVEELRIFCRRKVACARGTITNKANIII